MQNYIKALNLCVDKDNWREYCHRPFRKVKHLCATNGKMLICIPNYYLKHSTLKHYEKIETGMDVQQYIVRKVSGTKHIRYTLSQLEALFSQAANEPIYGCKDCSGTGKVVYEYLSRTDDTYELEAKCPICNGTGIICNGIGIQGKKTQTAFRYATGLPLISITLTHTLMQIIKQIGIDTVAITHTDQHSITITINFDIIIVVMGIFVDENVHKHWDIIEPSQCVASLE